MYIQMEGEKDFIKSLEEEAYTARLPQIVRTVQKEALCKIILF